MGRWHFLVKEDGRSYWSGMGGRGYASPEVTLVPYHEGGPHGKHQTVWVGSRSPNLHPVPICTDKRILEEHRYGPITRKVIERLVEEAKTLERDIEVAGPCTQCNEVLYLPIEQKARTCSRCSRLVLAKMQAEELGKLSERARMLKSRYIKHQLLNMQEKLALLTRQYLGDLPAERAREHEERREILFHEYEKAHREAFQKMLDLIKLASIDVDVDKSRIDANSLSSREKFLAEIDRDLGRAGGL